MKFGLIGKTLQHSVSPQIHENIFTELGMRHTNRYDLLEMAEDDVLHQLNRLKCEYTGLNVTIPYKVTVLPFLNGLSPAAERIGAVNTIHITKNGCFGYNTDYIGFGRSLCHAGINIEGEQCTVLGTGGAARSVIQYLADHGASHITVVSRTPKQRAKCPFTEFAERLGAEIIGYSELEARRDDRVLINCTPVGMFPNIHESPVSEKTASRYASLVNLTYNPKDALFLQYGKRHGAVTLNGMFMLVAQAVASEEIWMDHPIGDDVIKSIAEKMENIL